LNDWGVTLHTMLVVLFNQYKYNMTSADIPELDPLAILTN
jgi:hypothetical protein